MFLPLPFYMESTQKRGGAVLPFVGAVLPFVGAVLPFVGAVLYYHSSLVIQEL
jgi:hypothetical protein